MVEGEFLSAQYPRENVVAHVARDPWMRIAPLAERHRRTHVTGQAEGTQDAKRPDLGCFLLFHTQMYGREDAQELDSSVTEAFLKELARGNISPLSSTGAPHVRPRPPAASSRVTHLAQPAGEIPGPLFLSSTGNAFNHKEAFAILQRMARQANTHPRRRSTYVYRLHYSSAYGPSQSRQRERSALGVALSGHRSDRYIGRYA